MSLLQMLQSDSDNDQSTPDISNQTPASKTTGNKELSKNSSRKSSTIKCPNPHMDKPGYLFQSSSRNFLDPIEISNTGFNSIS